MREEVSQWSVVEVGAAGGHKISAQRSLRTPIRVSAAPPFRYPPRVSASTGRKYRFNVLMLLAHQNCPEIGIPWIPY